VSLPGGEPWPWLSEQDGLEVMVESEPELIARLRGSTGAERLRAIEPPSLELRAAAHRAGITVIDAPVVATGRLELRWYLREQTISRVLHRYGNVTEPAGGSSERRRPDDQG